MCFKIFLVFKFVGKGSCINILFILLLVFKLLMIESNFFFDVFVGKLKE